MHSAVEVSQGSAAGQSRSRSAAVHVANEMVAAALRATAREHGWLVDHAGAQVLITDRPSTVSCAASLPPRRVVVCEPTPLSARTCLDSVSNLHAVGVATTDDPADLLAALVAFDAGRVTVPLRVLRLASQMPELTVRQLDVLAAVRAGQRNADIARGLYMGLTSVKREIAALHDALEVENRRTLAARASELGVPARRAVP